MPTLPLLMKMITLMVPLTIAMGELRWGIMSTFPLPMPVMYDAQVFPKIFSTNKDLGVAYLPEDKNIKQMEENRTIPLRGSLCFTIAGENETIGENPACITLKNQSAAGLGERLFSYSGYSMTHVAANASILYGWWPSLSITKNNQSSVPNQPRMAPFCNSAPAAGLNFPWTGCQTRKARWAVPDRFSFSPDLDGNFTTHSIAKRSKDSPFDLWLLCGANGSCTDLSPIVAIKGATRKESYLKYNLPGPTANMPVVSYGLLSESTTFASRSYSPSPVCVWPPFLWIISNNSIINASLDCSIGNCSYSLCWNAVTHPVAVVVRMPRFVPMPIKTSGSLTLFRTKRDFGISTVIVGIVATAAVTASVTASAMALSTSVQTAQTINNLSASVSEAIDQQISANAQIQGGLMLVNQRIDLVQEQLDVLWQLAQLGCEIKLSGLCVTSIQYENFTRAANLSKSLSQFLRQNWTEEFENTLRDLRAAVIQINSTRLDLSLTEGLSSWISSAFSYFKEWVGVGLFGGLAIGGVMIILWLLCKFKKQHQKDKVLITQALLAVELGTSPQAWLNLLKQ